MRFSYSMPRVVLLIFSVAYFAIWAWHPIDSHADDGFRVLGPAMDYLFPAVFYCLAAVFILRDRQAGGDPAGKAPPTLGDSTLLLVLAAVLYLLPLAAMGSEGWKEGERIHSALFVLVEVCFILLCLSFAYEQISSLARAGAWSEARGLGKLRQRVGRWFLRVAGLLHPSLLLGTGAILVLASLFLPITGGPNGFTFLLGKQSWITSIYEVTGGIGAIQFTKAFFGRAVYVLALGAALITLILVVCLKLRATNSRASRLWMGLIGLSSFLAIYSAVDLNFGWLGLSMDSASLSWGPRLVGHWVLFCLWLILWLIPLVLWVRLSLKGSAANERPHMSSLSWLILLFLPVVLCDVVISPVLFGGFLNLTGLASYVAGLQFLCWGFVRGTRVNPNNLTTQ